MAEAMEAPIQVTAEQCAAVAAALQRRDLVPRVRERLEVVKAAAPAPT